VPVIVLDHLSEAQKRVYIIADNQLALNSGWDEDLLPEKPVCASGIFGSSAMTNSSWATRKLLAALPGS
jgi:hypothetical protein